MPFPIKICAICKEEFELKPDHLWSQHPQCLLEQFLPGVVALQHYDRFAVHGCGD